MIDLRCGDCLIEMAGMPENSVDSIITDPPYGLGFMGKEWDTFKGDYAERMRQRESKRRPRADGRTATGFQEASYAGLYDQSVEGHIKFQQWCAEWLRACLRVAKPGASLLAFGGTRTFHRLACAIEDAGWEIRDTIMWVYGSGFPKSLDISKAIDKEAGAERKVVGRTARNAGSKSAHQFEKCRELAFDVTAPATAAAQEWNGWGTALKPAWEPIIVAMKPLDGTFAQNAQKWGVAGLNVDGCRIRWTGTEDAAAAAAGFSKSMERGTVHAPTSLPTIYKKPPYEPDKLTGRWPANVIHDGSEEALAGFPETMSSARNPETCGIRHARPSVAVGVYDHRTYEGNTFSDSGSAARFFYCAKASRAEREAGLEGMPGREHYSEDTPTPQRNIREQTRTRNHHPTVKPLALMRYLCRLTKTPTGGIVLDPFMGSGTTGCAAVLEGRDFIGIEIDPDYVEIARRRIAAAAGPLFQKRGAPV